METPGSAFAAALEALKKNDEYIDSILRHITATNAQVAADPQRVLQETRNYAFSGLGAFAYHVNVTAQHLADHISSQTNEIDATLANVRAVRTFLSTEKDYASRATLGDFDTPADPPKNIFANRVVRHPVPMSSALALEEAASAPASLEAAIPVNTAGIALTTSRLAGQPTADEDSNWRIDFSSFDSVGTPFLTDGSRPVSFAAPSTTPTASPTVDAQTASEPAAAGGAAPGLTPNLLSFRRRPTTSVYATNSPVSPSLLVPGAPSTLPVPPPDASGFGVPPPPPVSDASGFGAPPPADAPPPAFGAPPPPPPPPPADDDDDQDNWDDSASFTAAPPMPPPPASSGFGNMSFGMPPSMGNSDDIIDDDAFASSAAMYSSAPPPPPPSSEKTCRVLYSYEATAPEELSLKEGDTILIISEDIGDGWTEGEDPRGVRGFFPTSYVEFV
ncbi:hypothetical protein H696_03893 [Fonticula alba]|uniref:SH3 domain-containing protein n=1 Tax=Fonticula alba TaxID=691883 RepID=A0A058Z5D6_FONAL|nr:hypothetical protein H696_03893 [Fonticula alba]KCV69464.1 hypothetical protein H696_03893 [Fonticula alba]|eukprot:XP_009496029.1 hypothetical protein H696_03893 [Fonticula alba]